MRHAKFALLLLLICTPSHAQRGSYPPRNVAPRCGMSMVFTTTPIGMTWSNGAAIPQYGQGSSVNVRARIFGPGGRVPAGSIEFRTIWHFKTKDTQKGAAISLLGHFDSTHPKIGNATPDFPWIWVEGIFTVNGYDVARQAIVFNRVE